MSWEHYYPLHKGLVQSLVDRFGGEVTDVTSGGDVVAMNPDGRKFFFNLIAKTVIWEQQGGSQFKFTLNGYLTTWEGYTLPASVALEHGFDSVLAADYLSQVETKKALRKAFFEECKALLEPFAGVSVSSADPESQTVTLYRGRDFRTCPVVEIISTAEQMVAPMPQKPKPKTRA